MDGNRTEADAMVIEDGIILRVGSKAEFEHMDAKYLDMEGKTILPGFIDGHSHIVSTIYDMMMANANPSPKGCCDSIPELIESLKKQYEEYKKRLKPEEWFMAMGYDESAYPNHSLPTKYDLDQICPDRPMCCVHASGHNAVFNSLALKACGIDENYVVPSGGAMPKLTGTNEYSGLLQETAFINLAGSMKVPGAEAMFEALQRCVQMYASYGITTAQDGKSSEKDLRLLKMADAQGLLKQDIVCYIDPPVCETNLPKEYPAKNPYQGHVRYAGYKLFLDGSPQAKTAWLTKSYYEVPEGKDDEYCGFPSMSDEEALKHMETCLQNNWQINVHTNGDAAIDQFLRCYAKALEKYPDRDNLRPVFIHCQTVREDQLDLIKKQKMLISFFEDHVYYWGDYHYDSVLGPDRAERISPLASAINRGINCTLHQDTPVVQPDVLFAVHNAVNRMTKAGRVLGKEQRVSIYDALRVVTYAGAYQIFEEDTKGSLEPGKYADLVVLDQNPLKVSVERIKDITVLETIKNGISIYRK